MAKAKSTQKRTADTVMILIYVLVGLSSTAGFACLFMGMGIGIFFGLMLLTVVELVAGLVVESFRDSHPVSAIPAPA